MRKEISWETATAMEVTESAQLRLFEFGLFAAPIRVRFERWLSWILEQARQQG